MIIINNKVLPADVYYNFRDCAIENDLWWALSGGLAHWNDAFHGLGFKSYRFFGGDMHDCHRMDDAELNWFILRFS